MRFQLLMFMTGLFLLAAISGCATPAPQGAVGPAPDAYLPPGAIGPAPVYDGPSSGAVGPAPRRYNPSYRSVDHGLYGTEQSFGETPLFR